MSAEKRFVVDVESGLHDKPPRPGLCWRVMRGFLSFCYDLSQFVIAVAVFNFLVAVADGVTLGLFGKKVGEELMLTVALIIWLIETCCCRVVARNNSN